VRACVRACVRARVHALDLPLLPNANSAPDPKCKAKNTTKQLWPVFGIKPRGGAVRFGAVLSCWVEAIGVSKRHTDGKYSACRNQRRATGAQPQGNQWSGARMVCSGASSAGG
jgi:hypothetical protein